MLKEFVKKIQNLEESDRRRIFVLMIAVSAVAVFGFWLNQVKSIFDGQSATPQKKTAENDLPSITESVKSSAKELNKIFSGLGDHLKSQITSQVNPETQIITPAPVIRPAESLPPAVKLPE